MPVCDIIIVSAINPMLHAVRAVVIRAVESESRSRSQKDFQPKESESQKILTTPTPGRPFAHQL